MKKKHWNNNGSRRGVAWSDDFTGLQPSRPSKDCLLLCCLNGYKGKWSGRSLQCRILTERVKFCLQRGTFLLHWWILFWNSALVPLICCFYSLIRQWINDLVTVYLLYAKHLLSGLSILNRLSLEPVSYPCWLLRVCQMDIERMIVGVNGGIYGVSVCVCFMWCFSWPAFVLSAQKTPLCLLLCGSCHVITMTPLNTQTAWMMHPYTCKWACLHECIYLFF